MFLYRATRRALHARRLRHDAANQQWTVILSDGAFVYQRARSAEQARALVSDQLECEAGLRDRDVAILATMRGRATPEPTC